MRYSFAYFFHENTDGSMNLKVHVRVGGIFMGPQIKFIPGIPFGGIDVGVLKGRDVEAQRENNVYRILGFY